jgi:hypothetical protein
MARAQRRASRRSRRLAPAPDQRRPPWRASTSQERELARHRGSFLQGLASSQRRAPEQAWQASCTIASRAARRPPGPPPRACPSTRRAARSHALHQPRGRGQGVRPRVRLRLSPAAMALWGPAPPWSLKGAEEFGASRPDNAGLHKAGPCPSRPLQRLAFPVRASAPEARTPSEQGPRRGPASSSSRLR